MNILDDDQNYTTIPIIGTVNINEINPNIYILDSINNTNFSFIYNTLLYTNMKCRITTSYRYNIDDALKFKEQYIKEHHLEKNPKEMKKFLKLFQEIYEYKHSEPNDLSKFIDIFNNNEFPMPICNYKSCYKKDGFFIINYRDMTFNLDIDSTAIFSEFLNSDFSNFDIFFEFFTKYFLSFIYLFDENDKKNLKANHFYKFDKIYSLAQKYHDVILHDINNYQLLFKNFIDYTYNYTNDTDIKTNDFSFDAMRRFLIFRRINFHTFDCLINNIKTKNLYDVELFPVDIEKIYDKNILLEKFNTERSGIRWGTRTYTNNIFSLFYYIFYKTIFNETYIIKKCKNCNKYFFTKHNSAQLYCDNLFNEKQTCKDIGNQIAQLKKQHDDLVYGKYRKIYAKKAMLVKRNPDIESYKIDYENWKKEAQEYRDKLKKEKITNEEFEKWLDTYT